MSQAQAAGATIGVIGGSSLYDIEGMHVLDRIEVATPFGAPSDSITLGQLEGQTIAFLPRHGRGHRISPTDLPVQANIYAMKKLGVRYLISVSAVGSLRDEIEPLDLVVPDQIFDRTALRTRSFFGGDSGIVAHVGMANPFCETIRPLLRDAAAMSERTVHYGGTYICIEGPQFSTKAESNAYRQWGADIIGMTAIPEAKLAREAEMHYAMLALSTDYDVWHESGETVTVEMVIANMTQNVVRAKETLHRLIPMLSGLDGLDEPFACGCDTALANAIQTARDSIPAESVTKMGVLLEKYF